jgi:hypothetical protein
VVAASPGARVYGRPTIFKGGTSLSVDQAVTLIAKIAQVEFGC